MPDPTPNRGYERPEQGTDDWHLPLNENFTKLDEDVQNALDTSASGSPFFTTDHSLVDRVLVAETGADIQPAIDAIADAGVTGVVQLLPGEYSPPAGIDLKGSVTLQGASEANMRAPTGTTAISADNVDAGTPLVRWRPNSEEFSASGAMVKDIVFQGKRKDGVQAHGLICPSTVGNPRIIRCFVNEFWGNGMAFSGTQSGEVIQSRVSRSGTAANDTHGLDVGGGVADGDFDRATIITSGFFGNGPTSDASPVKIRSGSTLRFKPGGHRTGVRGHGPMAGNPVVDVDGGDLEMDNAIVTTNITDPIGAGIRLANGGSVHLVNTSVEKGDPCILYEGGSLSLVHSSVNNGKLFSSNGMGHGLWIADSGKAEEYRIKHTAFFRNQGDGLNVGRPGIGKHIDIESRDNDGWGLNVDRLSGTFRAILFDRNPNKPNGLGDISDESKVELGTSALD